MRRSIVLASATLFFLSCGEATDWDNWNSSELGNFAVALSASSEQANEQIQPGPVEEPFEEIIVSVSKVTVQVPGQGWVELSDSPVVIDLMRLGEYGMEIGLGNLPEGRVGHLRLYLSEEPASYVTTASGHQHPLRVPSGEQSGIKVHGLWDVDDCTFTTVSLDFDNRRSILVTGTGHGREYIMRPVIRPMSAQDPRECDPGHPGDAPGGSDDSGDVPGGSDDSGDVPGGSDDSDDVPGGSDDSGDVPGGSDDSGDVPGGSDDSGDNGSEDQDDDDGEEEQEECPEGMYLVDGHCVYFG